MTFVLILLIIQTALLAYSATRHSPTHLEPAFLAAGISHWHFGRYELYRVNPPLVRMVASIPLMFQNPTTDWSRFYDHPGARSEFPTEDAFVVANGRRTLKLMVYARWACIPFAWIGAVSAFVWARQLYGSAAGLGAITLFVFEPNLLAHAELITPDCACVSLGLASTFLFWAWLNKPTWPRTIYTGASIGAAVACKSSWIILYPLFAVVWLYRFAICHVKPGITADWNHVAKTGVAKPVGIFLISFYFLNLVYAFDGTGTRLGSFNFVSTAFTGNSVSGVPGNRFSASAVGNVPVPLPKQFVLGVDSQAKDFEAYGAPSFLRGQ